MVLASAIPLVWMNQGYPLFHGVVLRPMNALNMPLRFVVLLLLALLAGCAHYRVNEPLPQYIVREQPVAPDRADDLLVVLTFSGGGSRASALAYGVLEELAQTRIAWNGRQRRLLDEVDVISAVSGGSFTAAYFALKGDRIFDDFEPRFLRRDVDWALVKRLFWPRNWLALATPYYNRSEMAEAYYDEVLFDGATFGDIDPRRAPALLINATDITLGDGFSFDQTHFDLICSRLDRFPIARAVTASSAVPGLFSAVTIANYAGSCGYETPRWVRDVLASPSTADSRLYLARKIAAYEDREGRPYIHLLDGGLADNLGLRALIDRVKLHHRSPDGTVRHLLLDRDLKKILVIVVNAAAAPDTSLNRLDYPPSIATTVDIATTVQVNRYNDETLRLFRENLEQWQQSIRLVRCGGEHCDEEPDFYLVDASLMRIDDEAERTYLQTLPTSFSLEDEAVDRLIAAGHLLLRQSPRMRAFVESVSPARGSD